MGRRIVTAKDVIADMTARANAPEMTRISSRGRVGETAPKTLDDFEDRITKEIPAEVIAAHLVINGALLSGTASATWHWLVFFALTLFTLGFITVKTLEVKQKAGKRTVSMAWGQITIATLAFVVWVFTLGGPFKFLGWYKPFQGSVLLAFFAISLALYEQIRVKADLAALLSHR